MNLLLINDDSWGSPGIVALEQAAKKFGDVTVVAPERPQSGISHQLTFDRPMKFTQQAPHSYALDGTPADCARYAISQLGISFDWVLSGINNGANAGVDVFVSGTVAAAREATLHGVNAIALSQHRKRFSDPEFDWSVSQKLCENLFERMLRFDAPDKVKDTDTHSQNHWPGAQSHLSNKYLINVNLPDLDGEYREIDVVECNLDRSPLPTEYEKADGQVRFSGRYNDRARLSGCDVDVSFSGKVSVTYL